jgi:hypothetical protein
VLPASDTSLGSVFDTNRRLVGDDGVDMIMCYSKYDPKKNSSYFLPRIPSAIELPFLFRQKKKKMLRWTLIILFIKVVCLFWGAAAAACCQSNFLHTVVMATASHFHRAGLSRTSGLRLSKLHSAFLNWIPIKDVTITPIDYRWLYLLLLLPPPSEFCTLPKIRNADPGFGLPQELNQLIVSWRHANLFSRIVFGGKSANPQGRRRRDLGIPRSETSSRRLGTK